MQETIGDTTYQWTDISNDFAKICRQLPVGEVVRDPDFSLFEAMTALELMDPKMDGGMSIKNHFHEQQQGNQILTLKQLIERNLLKFSQFTSDELIHLFDQLFSTFHMWLDGHSLALTLFTCVYLHDIMLVDDFHLRTISLTFIKLIDYIRDRILLKAGLCEEEDFSGTLTYNFPFYRENIKDQMCLRDLKKSEDELNKRLRALKHEKDFNENSFQSTQQIIYRVKFLRLFFTLILKFNEADEKTGEQMHLNADEISRILNQIDELLGQIRPSCIVDKAKVKEKRSLNVNIILFFFVQLENIETEGQQHLIDSSSISSISRAFDPFHNYRQLPPAFNRFIRQLIVPSMIYSSLKMINRQFRRMLDVNEKRTLTKAFEFFVEYSNNEKPSLFVRSLLLLSYLPSAQGCLLSSRKLFGEVSFADQVKYEIRLFILPPLLTLKYLTIDQETSTYAENFFQRACVPFSNLFYSLCNNRARTREKLSNLLEEFSVLQDESDKLDQWLHKYLLHQLFQNNFSNNNAQALFLMEKTSYFFQFILHWTLLIMEYYLLMGFDSSLYSKRELYDVYFYFSQVILLTHINVYKTSANVLNTTTPFLIQSNQKQTTTKNSFVQQMVNFIQQHHNDDPFIDILHENNVNPKKNKRKTLNNQIDPHEQEVLLINGHFSMSTAMHRCFKGLDMDRRLKFSRLIKKTFFQSNLIR